MMLGSSMGWRLGVSMLGALAAACGGGVSAVGAETSTGSGPEVHSDSTGTSVGDGSTQGSEAETTSGDPGSTSTSSADAGTFATTTMTGEGEDSTGEVSETTGAAQRSGWTERTAPDAIWPLIAPATQAVQLVVDPHATDRLALRVTDSIGVSGWAIWEDGEVEGPELDELFSYSNGEGFDNEGRFTGFYELGGQGHLMHWTGPGGVWVGVALQPEAILFDWPPHRLTVGMGAPARSLVHSDEALWHSTPWTYMPQTDWTIGIFCGDNCFIQRVVYRPGDADALVAVTSTGMVLHCEPDIDILWSCAEAGAAPTTELGMWVTLADPDRLVMKAPGELFVSDDAGATFSTLETPTPFFDVALSPLDPERMVIWSPSGIEPLHVTDDLGQTWTPLPLPETEVQSLYGVGIDGAGTFFTLRGGGVFSHPASLK